MGDAGQDSRGSGAKSDIALCPSGEFGYTPLLTINAKLKLMISFTLNTTHQNCRANVRLYMQAMFGNSKTLNVAHIDHVCCRLQRKGATSQIFKGYLVSYTEVMLN